MLENLDLIAQIATIVLSIVTGIVGPKLNKYMKMFKALAEIVEDGEVSKEEAKKIKRILEKM